MYKQQQHSKSAFVLQFQSNTESLLLEQFGPQHLNYHLWMFSVESVERSSSWGAAFNSLNWSRICLFLQLPLIQSSPGYLLYQENSERFVQQWGKHFREYLWSRSLNIIEQNQQQNVIHASRALQYSYLLSVNALIYFPWQKAVLVTISIWLLKTCFRDRDDMNKVSVSNLLDRQHVFVSWAPSANVISAPYFLRRSWIVRGKSQVSLCILFI